MLLEYIPALKMYRSTTPTPPVIELFCWVDYPDGTQRHARIEDVQGNEITVELFRNDGSFLQYWTQPRANVHKVHSLSVTTGEVLQFFGEPKPC